MSFPAQNWVGQSWKELYHIIDKEVEVLFQLLVDLLHLSVTLWMVGHSGSQLYAKEVVELSCQLCYKPQTLVGNDLF